MQTSPENRHLTALGYLRISDKKQMQGESIANQKASIENYAKANNIDVIDWFKDEAKSGKNADREELQNLLTTALKMKGQIDYVIVYKMSRASRDVESYVTSIRSVLASRGIQIRSATEQFDDSPTGRFLENFYIGMAQWDNDTKREMVVDNMTRIAQQGFWQHKPIRGYDACKINNDEGQPRSSMTPNYEAPKVKDILMRWNRGDIKEAELGRYATSIEFLGVNGKPIKQDVLHKIIINPLYAGYVRDKFTNYECVTGRHEALITTDVYEQNQLILKMKNKPYLLGVKHHKTNKLYPLRRFVRCVLCNDYMTSSAPHNSPRYFCHREACKGSGSIMRSTLHEQFESMLKSITPTRGTTRLLREILKRQIEQELGGLNQDISRVRGLLDGNDAYEQLALRKFITSNKITDEMHEKVMSGIEAERTALHIELAELEQRQTISVSNIEYALNFMADISERWHSAPLELKQAYQELVFPNGFVYDIKNQNFLTPAISPLYRVDLGETGAKNDKNFVLVIPRRVELLLPG